MPIHLDPQAAHRASVTGSVQPVEHTFRPRGPEGIGQRVLSALWQGLDGGYRWQQLQRSHDGHGGASLPAKSSGTNGESSGKAVCS